MKGYQLRAASGAASVGYKYNYFKETGSKMRVFEPGSGELRITSIISISYNILHRPLIGAKPMRMSFGAFSADTIPLESQYKFRWLLVAGAI